jgi:hypothetical protein
MLKTAQGGVNDNYHISYMTKEDLERMVFNFIVNDAGKDYRITQMEKANFVKSIIKNHIKIRPLSYIEHHLLLIEEIFRIPRSLKGDVIECGCFNGGSTVTLSLACEMTHRRLFVCDSFEGLPEVKEEEKYEIYPTQSDTIYIWQKGDFSSNGGIYGVQETVKKYGVIEVCQFVKGYFENTLKDIETESIVLVFEDADLKSSVACCLKYLWPKLQQGSKFISHEPWSINVVSLFYDEKWWQEQLHTHPPGFWGSGYGIRPAGIGFTMKYDRNEIKARSRRRMHHGSNGYNGDGFKKAK